MVPACTPNTHKVQMEDPKFEILSSSEFEASLGYVRPCFKMVILNVAPFALERTGSGGNSRCWY